MSLFRLGSPVESPHLIRGDGVYLRPGEMRDFEQWSSLRERSREGGRSNIDNGSSRARSREGGRSNKRRRGGDNNGRRGGNGQRELALA